MSKKSFLDTKGLETLWGLFKNKLTNYDDKQAINDKLANYETKTELASTLSDYTLKADFDAKVKGHVIEKDVPADAQFTDTTYWEAGTGEHSVQTIGNNNNAIGEASVAEGAETDAHAYASHAEGYMTSTGTSADYSHTEGYKTSTQGVASHAEGDSTVTNNPAEHAEGKYNKSNMGGTAATNTISSIGIGNASGSIPGGERKNAVEVMQNGDTYIVGIGSYDGKSIDTADTLQEVIEAKADKIDIPSNVSAFTNDAGYLTEHQDISSLATKAEVNSKQDKITVDNKLSYNLLSDTPEVFNGKFKADFTVTNEVGNYKAGDIITEGTSIITILQNILSLDTPITTDKLYWGITTSVPLTSIEGFNSVDINRDDLINGHSCTFISSTKYYGSMAYPKAYGDLIWINQDSMPDINLIDNFIKIEISVDDKAYNLYYNNSRATAGTDTYVFKIEG